jgi:predicted N-acetyltransferase YhbS
MNITIRQATPADGNACARIMFDAFTDIARQHNFPCDFPGPELARRIAHSCIPDPRCYCVVAEIDGKIVGSNFLDERDAVRGVGPITVDPSCQSKGVGRKLMEAVIERGKNAQSIRLVQEAFNRTSLALYASLGFDVVEPLIILTGKLTGQLSHGAEVSPMREEDLEDAARLCIHVHGFDRTNELRDNITRMKPFVLRRNGMLTAYCGAANFYLLNHGAAFREQDMRDLMIGASMAMNEPFGLLLPHRQANLFRWCLSQKMRIMKPMTLMSMGEYHEPRGPFFSSISY